MTYDIFLKLCNSVGKSPSAVALELGISKSTVSHWKHQRNEMTAATALKVANYFGITVEELKTGIKKEPSIPKDEELDKNDAISNLRKDVEENFPDYDLDKLSAVMDFVEARMAPEFARSGREKAIARAFSRMTDAEFDAFLDYLNKLREQ